MNKAKWLLPVLSLSLGSCVSNTRSIDVVSSRNPASYSAYEKEANTYADVLPEYTTEFEASKKYFIVQNVATEKTRVYEKCDFKADPKCSHKLIYEETNVVGGDDMRSDLGVQQIQAWVKFYQDNEGRYPSWYDPSFPPTPTGGFLSWTKKKAMPNGKGEMRGAFGWYAGLVSPTKSGQWMHGTLGWGSDGSSYIDRAHNNILKWFKDIRSHGCTRHPNPSIAYLAHKLPVGTTLIKVYAKEALQDSTLATYESQKNPLAFNYILTKEGVRKSDAPSIESSAVMERVQKGLITQDQFIEKGTYMIDQYPTVQGIDTSRGPKSGKSGDAYKIKGENMIGTYYIDSGRFEGYAHPKAMDIDGLSSFKSYEVNLGLPEYALKK